MPHQSMRLDSLADRLISTYTVARRSPRTIAKLRGVLAELIRTVPEDPKGPALVKDLTTDGVARWMASTCGERGPNTVIGLLGYVRAIASYAAEEGLLDRPPSWRRLRPRRARPARARHHPADRIAALLDRLEVLARDEWRAHRLLALVALVAYTGLRRDEALFLRRQDLHLGEGYLEVEPHHRRKLKTEESAQPVPIPPESVPILDAWLAAIHPRREWVIPASRGDGPWWGGSPGYRPLDRLKEAGLEVGIEGLTFQSLRRTWATHAETRWGLTDPEIMRVLRHTTADTSRRHYREADLANLRAIAERITYRGRA